MHTLEKAAFVGDHGKFILVLVTRGDERILVVRGRAAEFGGEYHDDIARAFMRELRETQGFDTASITVMGGGRYAFKKDADRIELSGRSTAFGCEDRRKTIAVLMETHPGVTIADMTLDEDRVGRHPRA